MVVPIYLNHNHDVTIGWAESHNHGIIVTMLEHFFLSKKTIKSIFGSVAYTIKKVDENIKIEGNFAIKKIHITSFSLSSNENSKCRP